MVTYKDEDYLACKLIEVEVDKNSLAAQTRYVGKVLLFLFLFSVPLAIHAQTLSQEFLREAREFWNKRIIKCGKDSYVKEDYQIIGFKISQFRNPRILVEPLSLSSADRLNGVEFRGNTTYTYEAYRYYQDLAYKSGNGLSIWRDGGSNNEYNRFLYRKNGQWFHTADTFDKSHSLVPVNCSDMSKFFGSIEVEPVAPSKKTTTKKLVKKTKKKRP